MFPPNLLNKVHNLQQPDQQSLHNIKTKIIVILPLVHGSAVYLQTVVPYPSKYLNKLYYIEPTLV